MTTSRKPALYESSAFARDDESDDREYYVRDRMVSHLDEAALQVVESITGALIVEPRPAILDLMASLDSHLPAGLNPRRCVGLGLNRNELEANPLFDERVVHDLNADPRLPFPDDSFDVVLNTVSVDYLTRPFEVVAEVARVLRPGGLFLVVYSNRFFPEKVVRIWREASHDTRREIVEGYLTSCDLFGPVESCESFGRPRPVADRHARPGLPSDPVVAVWAEKQGEGSSLPQRRPPDLDPWFVRDSEELERRKRATSSTRCCPYCGDELRKWEVPQTPFTQWDEEHFLVCFNDRCEFFLRGWQVMERQGNPGCSYRFMFSPERGYCSSMPVPSPFALRENIVDG